MKNDINDFESIIPTAITVAYPRTLTDIPYSKEIFSYLKNKIEVIPYIHDDKLAIEIEARYKLIDKLLKKSNINQILELAAGYSQRGLIFTKDKDSKYVELDLKQVTDLKKDILNSITPIPNNLKIISGDATNKDDFAKCLSYFNQSEKIAIIHEGLLRYLDFDEKRKVAKNVYDALKTFGGAWITCDFTPKRFIQNQDKNIINFNKDLSNITDRNNANWRFEDEEHVRRFLNDVGFKGIEFHDYQEIKNVLSSKKILGIDDDTIEKLIDGSLMSVISID